MANNKSNKVMPINVQTEKDLEEDSEPRVSMRIKVENFLEGPIGSLIDYISIAFSLLTFLVYLINSYSNTLNWFFNTIDIGILAFFLFEYCIKFYAAQHKNLYLFSFDSLIDFFTCIPLFIWYLHTEMTELIYEIT